jgi:hypothetical protein
MLALAPAAAAVSAVVAPIHFFCCCCPPSVAARKFSFCCNVERLRGKREEKTAPCVKTSDQRQTTSQFKSSLPSLPLSLSPHVCCLLACSSQIGKLKKRYTRFVRTLLLLPGGKRFDKQIQICQRLIMYNLHICRLPDANKLKEI